MVVASESPICLHKSNACSMMVDVSVMVVWVVCLVWGDATVRPEAG